MIYHDMLFSEYLKLPGINASKLKPYSISPRYGYTEEKKEKERSAAMATGRLVHAFVLEGEKAAQESMESEYITSGFPINKSTGKPYGQDTKKFQEWYKEHGNNRDILTEVQLKQVKKITRAVKAHSKSKHILSLAPNRETVITWHCPFTGFLCKAMVDFHGGDFAGDLKTMGKQLTFKSIEREMYDRQYHLQFAFYRDGLKENGFNAEDFYAIFVQSAGDYDVGCFAVDELTLQQGQMDYIKAIKNYEKATEDKEEFKVGCFPEITTIGIPNWALEFNEPDADILGVNF